MIPRLAAVLAALLLYTGSALGEATVHLEDLTSPEVKAAIASGRTTILIPIGGTEQNGQHIVLGKHNVRARVLAADIAMILSDALVAPVVAYVPEGSIDPPTGHMRGTGTISIPTDAFEKTLEGAARSFLHHGFKTVVLLGDHGGYQSSLTRVAARVNTGRTRAVFVPREYYRELEHAGVEDTALTLAVDPKLVRKPHPPVGQGPKARKEIVESTAKAIKAFRAR